MTAIVMSLQYQSSGVTSMLITTGPAVTVFLAHFFLPDETLTRRKIVGTVLSLAGTFFAQFLAFYIVKRFGATTFATTHYITPVVAGLGGILILEEHITTGMVAGVTLIALGIVLINRQHRA